MSGDGVSGDGGRVGGGVEGVCGADGRVVPKNIGAASDEDLIRLRPSEKKKVWKESRVGLPKNAEQNICDPLWEKVHFHAKTKIELLTSKEVQSSLFPAMQL